MEGGREGKDVPIGMAALIKAPHASPISLKGGGAGGREGEREGGRVYLPK